MKFDDFVKALNDAGWRNTCDAQHDEIKALHRKLWPVVAELESELHEESEAVRRMAERLNRKQKEQAHD
jgi:hypothetical protein